MSKHSTTHRTLSRRLAALLAAMALLAALALPVYAEALDGATGTAQAEIEDTISDGTVTTENDSTTPEGKEAAKDSTANADGNNASENKGTNDNASSSTTGDSNTTADDTVPSTGTTQPSSTDNIDTTAGRTTMDDTPDTMDEDAEQDIATRSADGAEESHITQVSAAQTSDSSFNIYFAVPTKFATNHYTGVMLNYQKSDGNWPGKMEMHLLQNRDYSGRKVYEITINPKECPECFREVQFHYVGANGNIVEGDGNFEKLSGPQYRSNIANKLYDADSKTWENFTPFDPNNHQTFAGKSMTFENRSNESLTNVKALFYEPDSANNSALTPVATVEIGNVDTNKRKSFAIPDAACSYIKFTADGKDDLSGTYNFYGQGNANQFIYNENTKYCFTYSASDASAWGTSQGSITIYFDATLSKLTYNKDKETEAKVAYGMPTADNKLWYYAKFADGSTANGTMTQDEPNSDGNIWYVSFTGKTPVSIRFAAWDVKNEVAAGNGDGTAMLNVPHNLEQPCFYADTSDAAVYEGGNRDGYWDELGQTRDAAKGKKSTVVDVESAAFTKDGKTKYISSTLYDYYSDWELNGKNRDTYNTNYNNETFANNRNWVTFRQFDQALSDYYRNSGATVNYPMYTGQFQPDAVKSNGEEWGIRFSAIASTLNLYGYANTDTKTFMAVNNSTSDINGNGLAANQTKLYDETFQGLAGSELKNGEPIMNGTTDLAMPFFNEEFLQSENSKKTKLGEVYKDVSFPFTQEEVFKESDDATAYEKGVKYWYFDSDKTTLYLKKDTGDEGYFLQRQSSLADNSKNLLSNSTHAQVNNKDTYGFFPFNSKSTDTKASTYNYGFGAKLQFQFTLTSDGKVKDNSGREIPIKFFFSGDDDVWVYIDDKLALDVGGDHGKASGLLEFGADNNGNNYTSYVSDIKASNNTVYGPVADKTVTYLGNKITFNYKSKQTTTLEPGTHTLTMYYMERGMWESNMAIAFNFPDHNELQVEKEVNLTDVNDIFKSSFQNRELFAFTIQNQATHYGAKEAESTGKVETKTVDLTSATLTTANTDTGSGNIFALAPDPDITKNGKVLHWYAPYTDISSAHRDKRYGILTLEKPIDISNMKYLTFELYVQSAEGQSTPSITNMYLELLDNQNPPKQKGGVNKASLSGTTYGVVTMAEDKWITVKLDLDKLTAETEFNNLVKTIRFGCNYPRDIYLKDFTFTSAVPNVVHVGFTTNQDQIPDYGSATSGELKNATNARFTSSNKTKGTQVVDKDGKFLLADGETVTFTDQFRRGSYISLKEELNDKLFDTSWTLYENDVPVTTMAKGNKVTNPKSIPKLKDVNSSGPDDGRTENKGTDTALTTNIYNGQKPTAANTIVFRSYSNPDAEADTAFTKLKVKYVNKVKTGKLTIKKQAASGEKLDGTYTFTVTFTNVGGLGLESEGIVQPVEIKGTSETTITGIPLGTRFRVEETDRTDSSHLQGVTFTYCDDGAVIGNKQVHGTITERADNQITTVTFTNTKHELFDMTLTKQWKDAEGKDLTTNLPKQIYVQLQRKKAGDTTWTAVLYPKDSKLDYVTIDPDNSGWHYPFVGLDRTDVSDNSTKWTYRVVEGTLGTDGKFTPLAEGKTILLNGNVYTVAGGDEETTGEAKNTSATLTNTLQNPKFNLDILKKSADEPDKPLAGVEFKLEKLTADGKTVDTNFPARIGITNAQGEVKEKGSNGNATGKNIFHDLEAGAYRLTETKTAEGYNLLSAPILVTFDKDGTCTLNGSKIEVSTNENKTEFTKNTDGSYTLALTVLNRKTPALPHTGADAPSLWLLIGLPLAVAGLLILVFRYNKKGGRTR